MQVYIEAYSGGGNCKAVAEATAGTTVDTSGSTAMNQSFTDCVAGQGSDCQAATGGDATGTVDQFNMPVRPSFESFGASDFEDKFSSFSGAPQLPFAAARYAAFGMCCLHRYNGPSRGCMRLAGS